MKYDGDVLDRNTEFNAKIKTRSRITNKASFRTALLVFILVLCISIIVIILVNSVNRSSQISNSDVRQTQLLCAAVNHPTKYIICRQVGLPQKIGEVK